MKIKTIIRYHITRFESTIKIKEVNIDNDVEKWEPICTVNEIVKMVQLLEKRVIVGMSA